MKHKPIIVKMSPLKGTKTIIRASVWMRSAEGHEQNIDFVGHCPSGALRGLADRMDAYERVQAERVERGIVDASPPSPTYMGAA